MADLLMALNWRVGAGRTAFLIAVIALTTVAILAIGEFISRVSGVSLIALQIAVWALWLIWLGVIFPRNRARDGDNQCRYPYRRAFGREILPGVAVAFSQLLRPVFSGVTAGVSEFPAAAYAVMALPLFCAGVAIVYSGALALGVARTLFVYEYVPTVEPVMTSGIFRILRHPLFLGGSMASFGLAIGTGNLTALELGMINICIIPIYVQLEDRRCCAALGRPYVDYRAVVGGVIPRRRSAMIRSASAHHDSGSIRPTNPRDFATTR